MRNSVKDRAAWTLTGNVAELRCEKLSARVDAQRPYAGVHNVAIDGGPHPLELLRVYRSDRVNDHIADPSWVGDRKSPWPLPLVETYVRGTDLVASYQAEDAWPFFPQLYWRAGSLNAVPGVIGSVSLLVSVQTHLLDTVPQIAVASRMKCEESLYISGRRAPSPAATIESLSTEDDCCVVSRMKDLPLSYIEIMPAGDFHAVKPPAEKGDALCEWRLFAEFLEKGVIRRARIHAAIVPRERDLEIAAACCEAIDRLELPLTT